MKSVEDKVVKRIYANHRGWVFSKNDFLDIGRDDSTRKALTNLEAKGTIRRVLRGLYDYPRTSKLIEGPMAPDLRQVAQAKASAWMVRIRIKNSCGFSLLRSPPKTSCWLKLVKILTDCVDGHLSISR